MGLFSFGGSSSSQSSEGSSQSSGQSTSESGGISGSISGGRSEAGSEQLIAFEDIFASLFGGASNAAAGLDPSMLTEAANHLFSGGIGFLEGLGSDAGSDYLRERLSGSNEVLNEQIDLLREDVGRLFSEELNPAITTESVGAGALGGDRQGVAQGIAAGRAGEVFTRGATALRAGDIAARDQVASILAENALSGAQTGLGSLGVLAGIAELGFGADLAPYERLAAILGDPTVLGSSFSNAEDFARAFSADFGRSQSTQESSSRTSSRGRSRSLDLGFI